MREQRARQFFLDDGERRCQAVGGEAIRSDDGGRATVGEAEAGARVDGVGIATTVHLYELGLTIEKLAESKNKDAIAAKLKEYDYALNHLNIEYVD